MLLSSCDHFIKEKAHENRELTRYSHGNTTDTVGIRDVENEKLPGSFSFFDSNKAHSEPDVMDERMKSYQEKCFTSLSLFLPSSLYFHIFMPFVKVPTYNFPFLLPSQATIHFPLCISFCPTATINFSYTCFNEQVGCLFKFVIITMFSNLF